MHKGNLQPKVKRKFCVVSVFSWLQVKVNKNVKICIIDGI